MHHKVIFYMFNTTITDIGETKNSNMFLSVSIHYIDMLLYFVLMNVYYNMTGLSATSFSVALVLIKW
jgi:hypothetical protein